MTTKIPRGMYGPNYDGTGDPEQCTPRERMTVSEATLIEEKDRRNSLSPQIRKQQAATDKALGRKS